MTDLFNLERDGYKFLGWYTDDTEGEKVETTFFFDKDEEVKEIYAYCNIHSLWKKEVK